MASELKPWRYEIKYGPEGEDAYSWVYDDHGAMVATMKTHKAKQIVDTMNTRPAPADLKARDRKRYKLIRKSLQNKGLLPAATDTGLVTVGFVPTEYGRQLDFQGLGISRLYKRESSSGQEAVVTRSQAEELLAAERAEREELEADNAELVADYDFMRKSRKKWKERAEKAEAELGFIERVKGVNEKYANALAFLEMGENDDPEEFAKRLWDKREALEAKLAAAEKALEQLRSDCQEPIDMYERNGPEFTSPHGNEYESTSYVMAKFAELVASIDDARAVLGGKPS
ncbi:hypothetical protein [Brucella anthropi]|uniref:hypothetical protein n=1 Tax=Brucella anthropi TaxID=529 RepID=UPI00320A0BF8